MSPQTWSKGSVIAFLFLYLILLSSCSETQNALANKSKKEKKQGFLIEGQTAVADESYTNIKGNSARFRAMMSGKYIQYSAEVQEDGNIKKNDIWLVNDGEDTVVTYILPVGDYNKVGYWMYYVQCLTSLPDNPVYSVFYKITEVGRDTIKLIHYRAPKDFKVDIGHLIKNPVTTFSKIELESLVKNDFQTTYVRKTPIKYIGETNIFEKWTREGNDQIKYKTFFFEVQPQYIHLGNIVFDENKKRMGRHSPSALLTKLAMVNPNFPLY